MIAIFSGAQLFALGIIGEYLARMHFRMMEKPTYVARKEQKDNQKENRWDIPVNRGYSAKSMQKKS